MALAEVVKAVVHLRGLLAEIDEMQHGATLVHEDNTACIAVANNTTSSRRAKHIDLRYFYVRELVLNEVIKIVHSASVDMVADVLTKARFLQAASARGWNRRSSRQPSLSRSRTPG